MDRWAWMFVAFGAVMLVAASFGFDNPSLSPGPVLVNDFQLLLGIGGLVAIVAGIMKGG